MQGYCRGSFAVLLHLLTSANAAGCDVRKCGKGMLRVILCADASVGGGVFPGMRAASSRGVVLEACLPQMRQGVTSANAASRCVALKVCCVFCGGRRFFMCGKVVFAGLLRAVSGFFTNLAGWNIIVIQKIWLKL